MKFSYSQSTFIPSTHHVKFTLAIVTAEMCIDSKAGLVCGELGYWKSYIGSSMDGARNKGTCDAWAIFFSNWVTIDANSMAAIDSSYNPFLD